MSRQRHSCMRKHERTDLGSLAHAHNTEACPDEALHDVVCGCVGVCTGQQLPHRLTAGPTTRSATRAAVAGVRQSHKQLTGRALRG